MSANRSSKHIFMKFKLQIALVLFCLASMSSPASAAFLLHTRNAQANNATHYTALNAFKHFIFHQSFSKNIFNAQRIPDVITSGAAKAHNNGLVSICLCLGGLALAIIPVINVIAAPVLIAAYIFGFLGLSKSDNYRGAATATVVILSILLLVGLVGIFALLSHPMFL